MPANDQNVIGPQLRKLRLDRDLTQGMLAARCGALGWDTTENVISKIELQFRCVNDRELLYLARALRASLREFYPARYRLR